MTGRKTSNYERDADDWYVEPRWCVDLLLDAESIEGMVYDPACGGGNIVNACRERGIDAVGSDLHMRGCGVAPLDFVAVKPTTAFETIITNPPYALLEAFVERAYEVAVSKICILARLAVLESQARYHRLWSSLPPNRVWVLSKRPSMPPGNRPDIKPAGGKVAYCWLVWDVGKHPRRTELGWLCPEPERVAA